MINEKVLKDLKAFGFTLDRIIMSSSSEVQVGVVDSAGNRWIGRAGRIPDDPVGSLQRAFEDSIRQATAPMGQVMADRANRISLC